MTAGRLVHKGTLVLAALVAAIAALVLATFLGLQAGPRAAGAADHLDAPGITPPPGGDGIGTDLTDIYAFQSPANARKTVLIMNVNGLASADGIGHGPGPDRAFGTKVPQVDGNAKVSYNFRVDSNGDAVPDITIQVRFGKPASDGSQKMKVKLLGRGSDDEDDIELEGRSTGFGQPVVINHEDGIRAFAGRRDDPFFFDLIGFLNVLDLAPGGRSFVGCGGPTAHPERDTFLGQNVSSIVLELPSRLVRGGGDSKIGVWATTNVGHTQIDRMGRPAINTVFIPNNPFPPDRVADGKASKKTTFNHGQPSTDVATWTGEVVDTLKTTFGLNDPASGLGGTDDPSDDAGKINALTAVLLPDILTVDVSSPSGFLNGRKPADDVIDAELGLITEGFVTTDCVGSNDVAFPSTFPYLGSAH